MMNRTKSTTLAATILFSSMFFVGCGNSETDKKVETSTVDTLNTSKDSLKEVEANKTASENPELSESNKVVCTEKESPNADMGFSNLTKTCTYKNYKTVSKGFPDYNGRYSYEYMLYKKKENGSFEKINNASLFTNKNELLSIINTKIRKDYNQFAKDPESSTCFEGSSFTPFKFDELGIDFNGDDINFHVTFGLAGACMSVDGTIVSIPLKDIQKYLVE